MLIDSNISGVIRQVEQLQAAIPAAMQRALHPDLWEADARALAQRTLLAISEPSERRFIALFVDTLTVTLLQPNGFSLGLRSPFPELRNTLFDAQNARAVLNPADLSSNLFLGQVQRFDDLIRQWVETPEDQGGKRRDARDWGKSDAEIAQLISYIMLSPNLGPEGLAARQRLTPHITDYLLQLQMDRLSGPVAERWLRAVLAAWRELIVARYPGVVRAELAAVKGRLL
jgi:hypothetical protein